MQNHNDDTIKTSGHSSLEKYTSHFIWKASKGLLKFYCEKELETEQNCNVLTPTLMVIIAFLSRSPGLLNRGPRGPAFLGHIPHSSIFSPTGLISNWLKFLCTELYNCSLSTFFLWASQIALIQPIHGQGYILIFHNRMHLLFTHVHFLCWLLGRGQYVTLISFYKVLVQKWV